MTYEDLIDLEIELVKAFHWSLYDIDMTNAFSMLTFIGRLAPRPLFADEAGWL